MTKQFDSKCTINDYISYPLNVSSSSFPSSLFSIGIGVYQPGVSSYTIKCKVSVISLQSITNNTSINSISLLSKLTGWNYFNSNIKRYINIPQHIIFTTYNSNLKSLIVDCDADVDIPGMPYGTKAIPVSPSTKYNIKAGVDNIQIYIYDNNDNIIRKLTTSFTSFNTPKNASYIKLYGSVNISRYIEFIGTGPIDVNANVDVIRDTIYDIDLTKYNTIDNTKGVLGNITIKNNKAILNVTYIPYNLFDYPYTIVDTDEGKTLLFENLPLSQYSIAYSTLTNYLHTILRPTTTTMPFITNISTLGGYKYKNNSMQLLIPTNDVEDFINNTTIYIFQKVNIDYELDIPISFMTYENAIQSLNTNIFLNAMYPKNINNAITSLPKNYLSTTSLNSLLSALNTATGKTIDAVYNETTQSYDFTVK